MLARILKILLSLPFLVVAGLFGVYLLFGFFLVNPLAQKLLPWVGETKLASKLSAQEVKFNPLSLELEVRGLKLAEPNDAPLAGFERLYVNLGTTGLFRWAWRVQDIQLDRPAATFAVQPGGRLNWQGLIDKLNEDKSPPSDTIARVLVDHVKITEGDIDYTDANRPGKPFRLALRPLGIELDGLSTLPEDRGDYLIAAKLPEQGGTLKWKGDIALNPVASSGTLGLEGVQLAKLLRVIKSPRKFDIPSGTLAAGLNYRFAMVRGQDGEDAPWVRVNGANLIVQTLAVGPRDGGDPVLQLAEARIDNANFDLASQRVDVGRVHLSGGRLAATRAANGTLDWQTLFAPDDTAVAGDAAGEHAKPPVAAPAADAPAESATGRPAAPAPAWKIAVREIGLEDWSARYTDRGFATPLGVSVDGFGLTAALAGEVGATPDIAVGPVNAALGPVRVSSGGREVAMLARAALNNAGLKLAERQLDIEAVELSGARTEVRLDKNKALNWNAILKPAPGAAAPAPARPAGKTADDKPFGLKLARLAVDGVDVAVVDESPAKPMRLDVARGFVTLRDLSLDLGKAVPVEAGFALKQGGSFNAQGSVVPGKPSGRLDLRLTGLSLKPFAPYVNQFARLDLQSGAAATHGKLVFGPGQAGTRVDYDGGFAVDDLAITEEDTGEAFLGWKKLSSDSLDLALAPDHLRMRELVAQHPFGKVIIFEDKSINLKRILRSTPETGPDTAVAETAAPKPAAPKPVEPKPAAAPAEPAFPVAIERVRIVGANAEFADLSLTPQFGTRMHDLSGVITGLSTDARTTAQVELDGKVDDYGSARVRGSIQPFQATEFTDLTLAFRNLEMANLTPYSGKFAGRRIDSGRLSVDLEYKIKQRQLAGENKFIVNKLRLGERVESPDAMNLPLDLAIALLEDSNGIIDLDLPVSGNLDDPQFSYGKIVWKAIVNVLTKLVTAPFRALGSLLGVNSEKLEAIGFDPGSSALLPPEQEKLKTLSEALAKRPALTLTLVPGYDPEADRHALQVETMRREAAAVAGIKLAPGEAPGPVDVNNYRIQTWLEDRYAASAGKAAYQTLRAGFQDKNAGAGARIMESEAIERLARRFKTRDEGPASAFHAELLARLTREVKIGDDALTKLAQARGQAMRDALVKLGMDTGRVGIGAPEPQALKDRFVGSKMTLGAGKTPSPPADAAPKPQ
ncbi:MAG: hypothetical protein BGO61_12025 [Thiobacillus sp. 65-69]|nr:DUF748 domain-containing protein [Thiobacillus sp.]ODU90035.1 MAG: hypothetical protein ABT21_04975 [Thiobacillus sp. SCN 65-179]OJW39644.1 MAG: hypothetical protein BGO61_12025 [Thiobacillus sp. 65-69]